PNGATEESTDQESAVLLQFSAATTGDELREVRRILSSSPGRRPVRLLFDRANGNALRLDAGAEFSINLTRELEDKLSRWLVVAKPKCSGPELLEKQSGNSRVTLFGSGMSEDPAIVRSFKPMVQSR